jgi:hypothetical protein
MGVMIKEVYLPEKSVFIDGKDVEIYTKMAIFTYKGEDDPVEHIDNAVSQYTNGYKRHEYNEFIDMNMDNPWVRIVTVDLTKDEMRDNKLKGICGI